MHHQRAARDKWRGSPARLTSGIAGLAAAIPSSLVARATPQCEDASSAAFYRISLALGMLIVSNVMLTPIILAVIGRGLVIGGFDPGFLRAADGSRAAVHFSFC